MTNKKVYFLFSLYINESYSLNNEKLIDFSDTSYESKDKLPNKILGISALVFVLFYSGNVFKNNKNKKSYLLKKKEMIEDLFSDLNKNNIFKKYDEEKCDLFFLKPVFFWDYYKLDEETFNKKTDLIINRLETLDKELEKISKKFNITNNETNILLKNLIKLWKKYVQDSKKIKRNEKNKENKEHQEFLDSFPKTIMNVLLTEFRNNNVFISDSFKPQGDLFGLEPLFEIYDNLDYETFVRNVKLLLKILKKEKIYVNGKFNEILEEINKYENNKVNIEDTHYSIILSKFDCLIGLWDHKLNSRIQQKDKNKTNITLVDYTHKNIDYKNLIDLTKKYKNVTNGEIQEIINQYKKYIENFENNQVSFEDTVFISNYYENFSDLINGRDEIYGNKFSGKNTTLKTLIKDKKSTIESNPDAINNMQKLIKKGLNEILKALIELSRNF
jgi:hypothetical protein